MAEPNKYRKKISELQKQLRAAIIRGDKELEKKLRNELRTVASTPFDSRIRKINNAAQNRQRIQKNAPLPVQRMNLQDPRNRLNNNNENDESTNNQAQNNPSVSKQALERYQEKPYGPDLGSTQQEPIGGKSLEPIRRPNPTTNQSDNANTPDRRSTEDQNIPVNQLPDEEDQAGETSQGESKSGLVDRGREFIQKKLVDQAKKLALQIGKKVAVFFAENPYAILIVLGIIILIITALILFSYFMNRGSQSPAASGASFTQPADPIKDSSWIAKFSHLAGMEGIEDTQLTTYLTGLSSDLTNLRNDVSWQNYSNKNEILQLIDEIQGNIRKYTVAKDKTVGQAIIDGVEKLIGLFDNQILPFPQGSAQAPLDNITGYNQTLHGGVALMKNKQITKEGHGTYLYNNQYKCDAVDLDSPRSTKVFAPFSGKLTYQSDKHGHLLAKIVDDNGYQAMLAHIDNGDNKASGDVKKGDKIGTIAKDHVHFELSYKGKCVVTTAADVLNNPAGDFYKNKKGEPWGRFLWDDMKKVLNIS